VPSTLIISWLYRIWLDVKSAPRELSGVLHLMALTSKPVLLQWEICEAAIFFYEFTNRWVTMLEMIRSNIFALFRCLFSVKQPKDVEVINLENTKKYLILTDKK